MNMIFSLNATQQTTLILVTHDDNLANRCQKIFTLEKGLLHPC